MQNRILAQALALAVLTALPIRAASTPAKTPAAELSMDQMWGDTKVKAGAAASDRAALFRDGNYGMFVHFGLYSHLSGQWQGQTFYGIGEWIMRRRFLWRNTWPWRRTLIPRSSTPAHLPAPRKTPG